MQRKLTRRRPDAAAVAVVAAVVVSAASCGPRIDRPFDAAADVNTDVRVPPPAVEPLPEAMPYTVVTLRGVASDARRIMVQGAGNPQFRDVLPGGGFCIDIVVPDPGTYQFAVYSQNAAGLFSDEAALVDMVIDRAAPRVPGAHTCTDVDPALCDARGDCTPRDR
jgi:hypothetical protein